MPRPRKVTAPAVTRQPETTNPQEAPRQTLSELVDVVAVLNILYNGRIYDMGDVFTVPRAVAEDLEREKLVRIRQ